MKSLIAKFKYAFNGLCIGCKDKSIQLQLVLMLIAILLAFLFKFKPMEWCVLILCCAFIVCLEMINTVLERMMDFIHPHHHEDVKAIKDMGAAFVLFASIVVFIIGLILFGGKIL